MNAREAGRGRIVTCSRGNIDIQAYIDGAARDVGFGGFEMMRCNPPRDALKHAAILTAHCSLLTDGEGKLRLLSPSPPAAP